ncbi:MAG: SAM-dependent methyltransferase, partial [uncultured Chloroflexi bacterium]
VPDLGMPTLLRSCRVPPPRPDRDGAGAAGPLLNAPWLRPARAQVRVHSLPDPGRDHARRGRAARAPQALRGRARPLLRDGSWPAHAAAAVRAARGRPGLQRRDARRGVPATGRAWRCGVGAGRRPDARLRAGLRRGHLLRRIRAHPAARAAAVRRRRLPGATARGPLRVRDRPHAAAALASLALWPRLQRDRAPAQPACAAAVRHVLPDLHPRGGATAAGGRRLRGRGRARLLPGTVPGGRAGACTAGTPRRSSSGATGASGRMEIGTSM